MKADLKRVLIIRAGALGDFVLTLPIFHCARKAEPSAEIDVLGYSDIAQLAVEAGLAKRVYPVDSTRFTALFSEKALKSESLVEWLRGYDLVVDIWRDPESRLVRRLRDLGVKEPMHVEPIPPEGGHVHAIDFALGQLPARWRKSGRPHETLAISPATQAWGRDYLRQNLGIRSPNVYAIHPGSGGRGKNRNWPADRFARVAKGLLASEDTACFIVRGPADDQAVRAVREDLEAANVPVAAGLKPVELAGVLSNVRAVIGNDSGVTHLAAVLGVHTIAIFGSTDSAVWGPRGPRVRVLQGGSDNIEAVSVSSVLREIER